MDKETMGYFLDGLRLKIKQSGMTQEAFAQGVTGVVNLSNILRGKVGTSPEMREALAARAGCSVEEIIQAGRGEAEDSPPGCSITKTVTVGGRPFTISINVRIDVHIQEGEPQ